jgi:hypothetical protein
MLLGILNGVMEWDVGHTPSFKHQKCTRQATRRGCTKSSLNFTMLWVLEDRLKHTREKKRASNRNTSKKLPSKPKHQPYSTSALSYRVSGEETSVRNCQVPAKHFPLSHGLLELLETSCRRCQADPRLFLSSLNPQAIRFRHTGSFYISQSDTFAPKSFSELKFKHKPRVWVSRMRLLFGLRPNQRDEFLALLQFIYTLFPCLNLNLNTNKQNRYSVFRFSFSFLPFRVFTALAAVPRY